MKASPGDVKASRDGIRAAVGMARPGKAPQAVCSRAFSYWNLTKKQSKLNKWLEFSDKNGILCPV
jgi:hypothetical protein